MLFAALILFCALCAAAEASEKKAEPVNGGQTYIEAVGRGAAPAGATGIHAKVLARRGAIVDLQRNLLRQAGEAQDAEVHGFIQVVELLGGRWDGEWYTVTGRIHVEKLRVFAEYSPQ